jgi:hypothetical protein
VTASPDLQEWLRPFYARLRDDAEYSHLTPLHQFDRLCQAVDLEQPGGAAQIRQWAVWAKQALLDHLEAKHVQRQSFRRDPAERSTSKAY